MNPYKKILIATTLSSMLFFTGCSTKLNRIEYNEKNQSFLYIIRKDGRKKLIYRKANEITQDGQTYYSYDELDLYQILDNDVLKILSPLDINKDGFIDGYESSKLEEILIED